MTKEHGSFHTLGQSGLKIGDGGFNFFTQINGIESGGLDHTHDHTGAAADCRVAAFWLSAPGNVGDIGNGDGASAINLDDGFSDVVEFDGHGEVADHDFLRAAVDESTRGVFGGFGNCLFEFLDVDTVGLHAPGIGLDLRLFHAAAHVENFGYAGNLQTGTDRPIGQGADIHGCGFPIIAFNPDEQDFAHERGDRS